MDYQIRWTNNPRHGPYGKMPMLEDTTTGRKIADSRLIIDYLREVTDGGPDRSLTREQWAKGHALLRLVEEHLYFAIMHSRWVDARGFAVCQKEFASAFPWGLRTIALGLLRWQLVRQCRSQGLGRLPEATVHRLAITDLDAVDASLSGPFLFGSTPTSFDASIFAFLQTIRRFPVEGPVRKRITSSPRLTAYCDAMENVWTCGTTHGSQFTNKLSNIE